VSSSRYQNWCIRDDAPELAVAGIVIFILVVAGLFGLVTLYSKFFLSGMATRVVTTGLPIEQIRNVFVQKVAGSTWKIVDDGTPMIAQSPLLTGIRQQIGLEVEQNGGRNMARVTVLRWTEKYGIPNKAYTLRMRLSSFVNEMQRLDPGASVTTTPLKG